MPELTIGTRRIPYDVRESSRATRQRIEATPDQVTVIVPEGTPEAETERFVESRRRWIFEKTEELRSEAQRLKAQTPTGYHSGAKVLYRGRYLRLRVEPAGVESSQLEYRSAFHIQVPQGLDETERESAVKSELNRWIDERLLGDARAVVRSRGQPADLVPRDIVVRELKTLWGSCGKDRVLRLDRKLSRVPRSVFEYVVVHEICHLRIRDHSDEFWELVGRVLPDFEPRRDWLRRHEVEVG